MTLTFTRHAERRRIESGFSVTDVRVAVTTGEVIERYPDDAPYPSRLVIAWVRGRPIHVVAADASAEETIIITVYEPDPDRWDEAFRRRR